MDWRATGAAAVVGGGGAVVDVEVDVVVATAATFDKGVTDFSLRFMTAAPPAENNRPARSTTSRRFELPMQHCSMPAAEIPLAARRRAAAVAGHTGDVVTARRLSTDANPGVRATAIAALARVNALDAAALAAALRDEDAAVRRRGATLAATAKDRAAIAAVLLGLLDDDEHLTAEAAAWALGEWGQANPLLDATLAALITMTTTHDEALCREAAVAALGAIGDERGLDAVLVACNDKPAIRRRAVLALSPFDGPRVEAAIDQALADRDWQVRQAAEDLRR